MRFELSNNLTDLFQRLDDDLEEISFLLLDLIDILHDRLRVDLWDHPFYKLRGASLKDSLDVRC